MSAAATGARRRRGFALLAALGVLSVVFIMAVSASMAARFTWSFLGMRLADQKLRNAARGAAEALAARPELLEAAKAEQGLQLAFPGRAPGDGIAVLAAVAGSTQTLAARFLAPREGDATVLLSASALLPRQARHEALYLVNVQGRRRAPILLEERTE